MNLLLICDGFINKYACFNDKNVTEHLFECIQEALCQSRINDKLETALILCFSDRRDFECLVQELTRDRSFKINFK